MDDDGIIPFTTNLDPKKWATTLHKIKTPLTIIKGQLDQALRNNEPSSQQLIKELLAEVNKLVGTVNDIGQNDDNIQPLAIQKIYLNKLASFIIQKFQLTNPDLSLSLKIDGEIFIYDNEDRIYELLVNLVENACKYTDRGYVSVEIRRDKEHGLLLSVTDTGIGISKEDLPHIFETFYRSPQAKQKRAGYGMGLYIVKQIIEILHGEIEVKSTLQQGSTFLVKLPL
ncbi:MAG: HAMP domain-containing sensor histidine kinase [Candidatus Gracilibacteria bacterium]|nr:HAMP domain-containing sensor histidine kinase [Candidatus Gracilibacteria bacterium]